MEIVLNNIKYELNYIGMEKSIIKIDIDKHEQMFYSK